MSDTVKWRNAVGLPKTHFNVQTRQCVLARQRRKNTAGPRRCIDIAVLRVTVHHWSNIAIAHLTRVPPRATARRPGEMYGPLTIQHRRRISSSCSCSSRNCRSTSADLRRRMCRVDVVVLASIFRRKTARFDRLMNRK